MSQRKKEGHVTWRRNVIGWFLMCVMMSVVVDNELE